MSDPDTLKNRRLWLISIGVHLLALFAIFFVPAKEYFEEEREGRKMKPPEIKRRGEELERVMEQVRDLAAERIAEKVALLDEGAERMATNFDTLNEHHQPLEEERRANALDRMALFAERTLANMDTLRENFQAAREADSPEAKLKALEGSDALGSRILVGQEEIRRGLMFLDSADEALVEKQTKAEERQIEAVNFVGWALDVLRGYLALEERIEEREQELAERREIVAEAERQLAELEKKAKPISEALEDLNSQRRQRGLDKETRDELDEKIKALKKRQNKLRPGIREQNGERNRASREMKKIEQHLENDRETLAEQAEEASWEGHLKLGGNVQNVAFYAQRDVVNSLFERAGREPVHTEK
ncbi:MAG: hypothetical protein ACOC4K_02210 [Verrucomicrobiota bacterium]